MGLFSTSSPFDDDVELATDGLKEKEDWSLILDICDKAKSSSSSAKDCLSSIWPRLRHQDPHIVLQAITLLDACIQNCGKNFHLLVASRDFETEFRKLLNKAKGEVRNKLLTSLRTWADGEFSKDPQLSLIPSLVSRLQQDGVSFPNESQKSEKPASVPRESNEDADLAKAIELSLKEAKETTSPKSKTSSGSSLYPSTSGTLYPSVSLGGIGSPEGRKVRALYDFEDAEDGELAFKAGEIITILDEADPNWWKGYNKRGEGLFPSNFVTSDLSVEPEQPKSESKRTVQFDEEVRVQKIAKEELEIDEAKMDRLLHYLHEADPTNPSKDPPDMQDLTEEVNAMGPLIDAELERVDSKHAQLSQLCMDLQGALNLYHSLMREPPLGGPAPGPSYLPKPMGYPYTPHPQMNGAGPAMMGNPYNLMPGSLPHPGHVPPQGPQGPQGMMPGPPPPHFIPDPSARHPNGVPQYGPPPGLQPPHGAYSMGGPPGSQQQPGYNDKPPLL